jgi:putative ABC transport system ATP-binding protein
MNPQPLLDLQDVVRRYAMAGGAVPALQGVSLSLHRGDFVALVGPSGCGKSTLLHLCGAMDRPTTGRLRFDGIALETATDDELTRVRRERVGFVFQFFNLLPTLTVTENIALPLLLGGAPPRRTGARARELAERLGLGARRDHYPQQLSGGEMQRCAIARAVVHDPILLIADEPTGNLDSENGRRILSLLADLHATLGVTLLLATHAADVAAAALRVVHMRDGRIEREIAQPRSARAPADT